MKSKKLHLFFLLTIAVTILAEGCKKKITTPEDEYLSGPYLLEYGNLPAPNIPSDNLLTIGGVNLGRTLFYDKQLSGDNSLACAGCHDQKNAFTDTSRFSIGIKGLSGKRQAMSVFNMAWNSNEFFWDGRAHLLRNQVLKPIGDELEMNETLDNVITKLKKDKLYPPLFKNAFGTEEINADRISFALEQFLHSVVSYNSKYDDFLAGNAVLNAEEERGRFLFFTEYNPAFPSQSGADCQHCHGGVNFENDKYMNNGLDSDAEFTDYGREKVTDKTTDRAKFKVPSLRNIALTFPYMHDGRFRTLEEVVDHYNLVTSSSTMDPSFQQQLPQGLQLSASDKAALVAFLKTLTDYTLINDKRYGDPKQ